MHARGLYAALAGELRALLLVLQCETPSGAAEIASK